MARARVLSVASGWTVDVRESEIKNKEEKEKEKEKEKEIEEESKDVSLGRYDDVVMAVALEDCLGWTDGNEEGWLLLAERVGEREEERLGGRGREGERISQ